MSIVVGVENLLYLRFGVEVLGVNGYIIRSGNPAVFSQRLFIFFFRSPPPVGNVKLSRLRVHRRIGLYHFYAFAIDIPFLDCVIKLFCVPYTRRKGS